MVSPRKPSAKPHKAKRSLQKGPSGFRPLAGGVLPKRAKQSDACEKTVIKPALKPIKQPIKSGPTPVSKAPIMLQMPAFDDYELLDSGFGQKLERYGPYRVVRPEGQALWQPRLDDESWTKADAIFSGEGDDDAAGRWRYQNKLHGADKEHGWTLHFQGTQFQARFTAFRHMGFFPEQAAHWSWFSSLIKKETRPLKVLNLFGYTGLASLIAAKAGAQVTHVDASKKAIGWARENQTLSALQEAPIRWICDDALKFVEREARRGQTYDGIIMDPPKYGRGPKGEVWHLSEGLNPLLYAARTILSENPLFFILSSYAIRASFMASHELARDVFSGLGGVLESGELLIKETGSERRLSTSLYTRWSDGSTYE